MFILVAGGIFALWLYLRPKPPDVRPMEHHTPARTVEVSSRPAMPARELPVEINTPAPVATATPFSQDAPVLSAENLRLGMTRQQVGKLRPAPKARLTYQGEILSEIQDARELQADAKQWNAGQTADLRELREALPTRRESQRSQRDGGVCHAFPLNGVEVRVWLKDGRYQKFALLSVF